MTYEVYRTLLRRQWRWRLRAGNGRIVCNAGESFHNKADCLSNIEAVKGSRDAVVRFV